MNTTARLRTRLTATAATLLTAALAVTGLATVGANPAAAAPTSAGQTHIGTVTDPNTTEPSTWARASNGARYYGCLRHDWSYAVDPVEATYDWTIHVRAYGGNSVWKAEGEVSAAQGAPATGVATGAGAIKMCSSRWGAGDYTLSARISFADAPHLDRPIGATPFTMRAPRTRTKLFVNDNTIKLGQRVRFRTVTRVETADGFAAQRRMRVGINHVSGPHWWTGGGFDFGASTNNKGVTVRWFSFHKRGKMTLRVETELNAVSRRSYSPTVTITVR